MTAANSGQLNLEEPPPIWGSRGVDCFEKLEQIGEGTYGTKRNQSANKLIKIFVRSWIKKAPKGPKKVVLLTGDGDFKKEFTLLNKARHHTIIIYREGSENSE